MKKPTQAAPESTEPEIVGACRGLYRAIDRLDQTAADHVGIARSDLRCLNMVEREPKTPTQIAKELSLTTGSVTALLDRLEAKGLVERSRDPRDRRGLLVSLTPLAFASLGPLYRAVAQELVAAVARYDADEQRQAVKHLREVTRACEAALASKAPAEEDSPTAEPMREPLGGGTA